jgi:hypothetical protein
MKIIKSALLIFALGLPGLALADGESVKITSPADGASIAPSGAKLVYEAVPGPSGDHLQLVIDGEQAALLSRLKGSFALDKLSLGDHTVCVKVVDKGQAPTGTEKCIKVTAANPGLSAY